MKFVVRLNDAVVICDVEIIEVWRKRPALEFKSFLRPYVKTRKIRKAERVDVPFGRNALKINKRVRLNFKRRPARVGQTAGNAIFCRNSDTEKAHHAN